MLSTGPVRTPRKFYIVFYNIYSVGPHRMVTFSNVIYIYIYISLFNVDAKNKVKNYNKKEIIVYIINYSI